MKIKIILFILVVLFFASNTRGQEVLDTYLKTAAKNNPRLKSLFNQYMAALEKAPQAGALPDPQLAFGYFISPLETRVGAQQAKISVSQMFPWFGTLNAQEEVAADMAKARLEVFEDAKNRLFFNVKSTYYNLYVLKEAVRITDETLELLSSFKKLALIKFEAGKASMVDVLRVEMEIKEMENQLAFLKDSELPLITQFEELLNTNFQQEIAFPDTLWQEDVEMQKSEVIDSIIAQNPLLKKLDYEMKSWENRIEVAHKQGMPSFMLGMSYINISERSDMMLTDNGKDAIILPQIGVRIPLYRSKYKAMVKESELRKEAVQFEKENTTNQFQTDFEKTYRDYRDAKRRMKLYRQLLMPSVQARDILIADYTSAGKDFEEILRMERKILKYALELEKARADQNTAVAYINYLMGK